MSPSSPENAFSLCPVQPQNPLRESCLYPWQPSLWVVISLHLHHIFQCASKHWWAVDWLLQKKEIPILLMVKQSWFCLLSYSCVSAIVMPYYESNEKQNAVLRWRWEILSLSDFKCNFIAKYYFSVINPFHYLVPNLTVKS